MEQITDRVGSFMNGSITAVVGSGITNMSELWISAQPRIDDPSKPRPSSNTPSVSSATGTVKCCHIPRKSMNFRSTMTAPRSLAYPSTSFAVFVMCRSLEWGAGVRRRLMTRRTVRSGEAGREGPSRRRKASLFGALQPLEGVVFSGSVGQVLERPRGLPAELARGEADHLLGRAELLHEGAAQLRGEEGLSLIHI